MALQGRNGGTRDFRRMRCIVPSLKHHMDLGCLFPWSTISSNPSNYGILAMTRRHFCIYSISLILCKENWHFLYNDG